MGLTAYEIDGSPLYPQPDSHEWDNNSPIGYDGDGAPILRKYRTVTLRSTKLLAYQMWLAWQDGSSHTVTLPAPGKMDAWTDYTTVYIEVRQGRVVGAAGMQGVEMILTRIVA